MKVTLDQLNRLSDTTPVLVNLKPVGNGYMEDFFAAGGMGALLRELKPLLHLDCLTVTGGTLGERLAADDGGYVDRTIIAARDKPFEPQGGLVALFGNLAPKGAILKRSAADEKAVRARGRGGGVLLARRSRRAHRRPDARGAGGGHPGAAERRPARARGDAGGRLSADPEEARAGRRQGHGPRSPTRA